MIKSVDKDGGNSCGTPLQVVASMSDHVMDDILTPLTAWLEKEDALPVGAKMALRLILEELLANAVMHGAARSGSDIRLFMSVQPNGIEIRFWDSGIAFNPQTALPEDTREDDLDDRPIGQLGWPLILHYCSVTSYERVEGQNRLALLFQFNG